MSIVIRPGATIGGLEAERLKWKLKANRRRLEIVDADRLGPELRDHALRHGLIHLDEDTPVPEYRLTPEGQGLLSARFGRRMSRGEALDHLDDLIDRLSDPRVMQHIRPHRVRLFGSVLRGEPHPADIDVIVICETADPHWTEMRDIELVFGTHHHTIFADGRITNQDTRWCDSAVIWQDGQKIDQWQVEPPDPAEAREFHIHEHVEKTVPVLDDPAALVTRAESDRIDEPAF